MLGLSSSPPEHIIKKPDSGQKCKICGAPTALFDVVDFNKSCGVGGTHYDHGLCGVPIYFNRCTECRFIFTAAFDNWTSEDFAKYIYNADYVRIDGEYVERRPAALALQFQKLFADNTNASILDYGAGSGVMAAKMREMGFSDIEVYDPFSSPARPARRFDFVISTEVVEHSIDPLGIFADMKSLVLETGAILFGTAVQPPDISVIRAGWWYMGPRNGHVSFYNDKSLCIIAEKMGFRYFPGLFHCFKGESANELTKRVTYRMDTSVVFLKLYAPPVDSPASKWQSIERNQFRWSKDRLLEWPLLGVSAPARINLELPFVNEVRSGFAAESLITVNGREAESWVEKREEYHSLNAIINIIDGDTAIKIETPETLRPTDLGRAGDDRKLGLAVLVK